MQQLTDHFDDLDLFDATIIGYAFTSNTLSMTLEGVKLLPQHPWYIGLAPMVEQQCTLVFSGVAASIRHIAHYRGDPRTDGFASRNTVEDNGFDAHAAPTKEYLVEAVMREPLCYCSWVIRAASFALNV